MQLGSAKLETVTDGLPEVGTRFSEGDAWVDVFAKAKLPTRFGDFTVLVFKNSADDKEHLALVRGAVLAAQGVPARLHSECLTGDVLGSLRCDCRDQLELAMVEFGKLPRCILLYMRQEGRGIGLGNKIRAYALQEAGMDTFEANRHLGFEDDLRTYDVAGLMVKALSPASIELVTNNPRKVLGLTASGVVISRQRELIARPNPHNMSYLRSKRKSGHTLPNA